MIPWGLRIFGVIAPRNGLLFKAYTVIRPPMASMAGQALALKAVF